MLEKTKPVTEVDQITFNWERVKKRASKKREELVTNAPNVSKRAMNTIAAKTPSNTPATRTTDTLTDPYTSIAIQKEQMASSNTQPPAIRPYTDQQPHDIDIGQMIDGTFNSELLPAPSPQEDTTRPDCDEALGPVKNAVALLRAIKEKQLTGKDLTMDERRLVVRSMKQLGQTQDAIADLLQISRRTIVSDYKVLRHEQALAIQATDTHDMAGEVYEVAKTCIRRALQAGSFKTVSIIMRDMVEVLQSLGVLYRAPKTSMLANLHGDIHGKNNGYQKYMDGIGQDKSKVVEVLDCMFDAIGNDQISEPQ